MRIDHSQEVILHAKINFNIKHNVSILNITFKNSEKYILLALNLITSIIKGIQKVINSKESEITEIDPFLTYFLP